MVENNMIMESPNVVRFSVEENSITVYFAKAQESTLTKDKIKEEDICQKVSVSFSPSNFISIISMMANIAYEYQSKYKVDMGVSRDVKGVKNGAKSEEPN